MSQVSVRFRCVDGVLAVWILCDDLSAPFVDQNGEGAHRAFLFVQASALSDGDVQFVEARFDSIAHGPIETGYKFLNELYAIGVSGSAYNGWSVPYVTGTGDHERDLVRSNSVSWAHALGQIAQYQRGQERVQSVPDGASLS